MTDTHITTVTEFAPRGETVTATLDVQLVTGERVNGPVLVGFYPDAGDGNIELWIEQEGRRVQFQESALPALVKQLRRTAKIAQEVKDD